jgi:molybdopterin/thiamine biosynthesis adenylyltransferase
MPDGAVLPGISRRRRAAYEALGDWLSSLPGQARPLNAGELASYHDHAFTAGWRLNVAFPDQVRGLDLLITERFPREPPHVGLVDRPKFLTWPHVERDGLLCLLPGGAEVDVASPTAVAANLLGMACELVEASVAGVNEADFRSEFLSYWNRAINEDATPVYSLVDPKPPSRPIWVWRGKQFSLVADDNKEILEWLSHYSWGAKERDWRLEPAALVWLEKPLLPHDYPRRGSDLRAIARSADPAASELIESLCGVGLDNMIALLGAPTPHGACFSGISIPSPSASGRMRRKRGNVADQGFRPGHVPRHMLVNRTLGANAVLRSPVERVDAAWVHGRGHDARFAKLRASTVAVLGCGSVGGAVAVLLAEAGVGSLFLVDPESVTAANLGRHPLGASALGKNKAEALGARIRKDYPHIRELQTFDSRWQVAFQGGTTSFLSCDMIISAMGDWAAEGALNEWHLIQNRSLPVVYGWTEPFAAAGHALAIGRSGGCLQCGFSTSGKPPFQVTEWPDGNGLRVEPACGVTFQPYGPIELNHTITLICELALDCLLGHVNDSSHRIWASRRAYLTMAGGQWSPEWSDIAGARLSGGFVEERPWPSIRTCVECRMDAA